MAQEILIWDGKEWQRHVRALLSIRYQPKLVCIPDKDRGDCGLEAYTTDGLAFQCYAPEEPLATAARYEKQRTKITVDLQKLRTYSAKLAQLLGPTVLTRWFLVVPTCESKDLLAHCEKKRQELLSWGLPFIDPAIRIQIMTYEDFEVERATLIAAGATPLRIPVLPSTPNDVITWKQVNSPAFAAMSEKLSRALPNYAAAAKVETEFLHAYIDGENAARRLRDTFPEFYERVMRRCSDEERFLATTTALTADRPSRTIKQLLESLRGGFLTDIPRLDPTLAKVLAHATVADWLMRCPLDFL